MSIGFQPLETKRRTGRGLHILKSLIAELSLVTIPANIEATVLTVKSAASGQSLPGVSGVMKARTMKHTAGEHIQNLENKRAALVAQMTDILNTAADGGATTDPEQATTHDELAAQVKSIDGDLVRWRDNEKMQIATARVPIETKAVEPVRPRVGASRRSSPGSRWRASSSRGSRRATKAPTPSRMPRNAGTTRRRKSRLALKAAVAAGTTTDATWAKPLINPAITSDFLPLLRAATIIGKIDGLAQSARST